MRLVLGFMTGTSLDGLDAAAVRLEGRGLALRLVDISATVSLDFPRDLVEMFRALSSGAPLSARDITTAARRLGELHAQAAHDLIARAGPPDLACAHGQTVHHAPPDSWQLFNPWPLARETNCPVVYDLRGADLAAGGQGAPITPLADWLLFRAAHESRAIVNLGGFCNITHLPASAPPEAIRGFDACACNHPLNAAARLVLDQPFDRDGAVASRGAPVVSIVEPLVAALRAQRDAGRSLGTGDELMASFSAHAHAVPPEDVLASVTAAVATTIAETLGALAPDRVLLAGGSVRHAPLVRSLQCALQPIPVASLDSVGVPAAHREAVEFAVLGALCRDRTPITLPGITGVTPTAPISGAWIDPRS